MKNLKIFAFLFLAGMTHAMAAQGQTAFPDQQQLILRHSVPVRIEARKDPDLRAAWTLIDAGSYKEAHEHLNKAANRDRVVAFYVLGLLYLRGYGVDADADIAMSYFKKGAARNHGLSKVMMAEMYYRGYKGKPDLPEAIRLLKDAAEHEGKAMFLLGRLYATGEGLPKNTHKAMNYYERAARAGYYPAATYLGHMFYENGQGKDLKKARSWFQRNANAEGDPEGLYYYGIMQARGEGGRVDLQGGYIALALSYALGYEPALPERDQLATKLTPEQRAIGDRFVRELIADTLK
jgi:TPR repeat protein